MHIPVSLSNPERGRRPLALALLLAALAGGSLVIACGPEFPPQLLDDRAATLNATPANSFAYEATHLVDSRDDFSVRERYYYEESRQETPDDADKGLGAQVRDRLKAMRQAADGDAAYAAGAGLPDALRLYTAGAVDYRLSHAAADDIGKDPAKDPNVVARRAARRFQAVLDLPAPAGAPRAAWAAYMLAELKAQGYIMAEDGGPPTGAATAGAPPSPSAPDDADGLAEKRSPSGHLLTGQAAENAWREDVARAYERVRAYARAGADDSQGLAVASYGQQALLYLEGPDGTCGYADISSNAPCADAIASADMKRAIHLYAEQAAQRSDSALQSLRTLAGWALEKPARAQRLIDDPVAQRLLVAYALARMGDIVDGKADSAYDVFAAYDITDQQGLADAALGDSHITPNPALTALTAALVTLPPARLGQADQVAALAYRVGRYDLAAQLADRSRTPLAWWVRAKLATRQGDTAEAAQAYGHAVQAFPSNDGSLEAAGRARLRGEQGVLSLARGQYVEALDQLYQAATATQPDSPREEGPLMGDYWNDVAYVAERVLTTEELRDYVDAHVPATAVSAVDLRSMDSTARSDWLYQHPVTVADRLRQLLARRLMREGQRKQALAYFPADDDARFMNVSWTDNQLVVTPRRSRQAAADYDAALAEARDAWRDITRARAWYRAALLARKQGMDLLGYEQDPDYAVYDGSYTYGAGRGAVGVDGGPGGSAGQDPAAQQAEAQADTPAKRAARDLVGPYITDEERRRYAATEAQPYARFHYREIAADHAVAAAGLLPARSQAYAATLCRAASFVIDDDPDRAGAIYKQYVKEGALVPFGATFGRACPAPDFEGAARFPYVQAWRTLRRHPAASAAAGAAVVACVVVVLALWRHRRRRRRRAEPRT
ncbi:hypothetical protein [Achromobacter aloeverae]|uniref:Tetratricopeptide repeat protein n=1 Tax=Achromobacter aloeverae TaxID=1750518 RepID=A0A4V1MRI9_9BURK|nr:hypothetical protein [Achromobacter aloeverae]RXN84474.1 hypothetical protein C7R54_24125 [Achromobacter aloeverae]